MKVQVLSNLFKRNKSLKDNIITKQNMSQVMSKEKQDTVKYQWKKGENFGKVVEVESTDGEFINFTDGSRIFKNVVSEFLEKVQGDSLPLPGADKAAAILKGEKIESTKVEVDNSPSEIPSSNTEEIPSSIAEETVKEPSIMGKMIMKMSKKNIVTVPIQINLNIPTQALYAMLSEGMEEQDLNDEIMEVALSQIEMEKLQDYIKSNVTDFLSEYYS